MRRVVAVCGSIVVAVLLAVALVVLDEWSGSKDRPTHQSGELAELLAQLSVADELPMAGYSREAFPHWDTNKPEYGFGSDYAKCTSRDVMLLRDAVGPVTLDPKSCVLTVGSGGGWRDGYGVVDRKSGELKPYKWMTESSAVDADHIVALAEAWRSGAATRDVETRRRIANDSVNLEAADPSANRSKGDQDAANYLPPGTFRCEYVDRYLRVKVKYALTVDPAEKTALVAAVDACTG